jgi:hypothetical protein
MVNLKGDTKVYILQSDPKSNQKPINCKVFAFLSFFAVIVASSVLLWHHTSPSDSNGNSTSTGLAVSFATQSDAETYVLTCIKDGISYTYETSDADTGTVIAKIDTTAVTDGNRLCNMLNVYGRGAGEVPHKTSCPSNMRDDGTSCWLDTYGRGTGHTHPCSADEESYGSYCYSKCRTGYYNVLCCLCSPDEGPGIKVTVFDRYYCDAGWELIDSMCYPKCQEGTQRVGCCICEKISGYTPSKYPVNCGYSEKWGKTTADCTDNKKIVEEGLVVIGKMTGSVACIVIVSVIASATAISTLGTSYAFASPILSLCTGLLTGEGATDVFKLKKYHEVVDSNCFSGRTCPSWLDLNVQYATDAELEPYIEPFLPILPPPGAGALVKEQATALTRYATYGTSFYTCKPNTRCTPIAYRVMEWYVNPLIDPSKDRVCYQSTNSEWFCRIVTDADLPSVYDSMGVPGFDYIPVPILVPGAVTIAKEINTAFARFVQVGTSVFFCQAEKECVLARTDVVDWFARNTAEIGTAKLYCKSGTSWFERPFGDPGTLAAGLFVFGWVSSNSGDGDCDKGNDNRC